MNIQQLNPWNWFKHEQAGTAERGQIPVKRSGNDKPGGAVGENLHPMFRLHREIDRLFDDVFSGFGMPASRDDRSSWFDWNVGYQPQINVAGGENSYDIELEVPGLAQSDISIEVQGDVLQIRGEKQETNEAKDKHYYRVERRYGKFQRTLALPQDANADDITASLKDGILKLHISRKPVEKQDVKKIEIH